MDSVSEMLEPTSVSERDALIRSLEEAEADLFEANEKITQLTKHNKNQGVFILTLLKTKGIEK